jgi:anthranilate synthase component 1
MGVRKILDYIASGDIYQANLAQSFRMEWSGDASELYGRLRGSNPAPFMGLFKGPDFTLCSSSPERLLTVRSDRIEMRPIAGTRPRGVTSHQDALLRRQLTTSPKEQAEHLMLVDLARNDLGRVARYGSVHVEDFARVEPYAKVQHLVSTVEGRLEKDVSLAQVVDAVFPGGTITGCPKRRCMEILSEVEQGPRGFYTGALGYLAPGLQMDLNILIRTMTLWDGGMLEFHAGAGIVADSKPKREYLETLHKAEALAAALGTSLVEAS